MSQNLPFNRSAPALRRLLGEARRETAEAAHIAASKRRRLAATVDADAEDEYDENDSVPAPISSGALGDDDAAVFADAVYEEDDKEADMIYEEVELRMQSRRQKQRDQLLQQQLKEYRDANPTVRQQFADLKAGLGAIAPDEWAAIPDIGDYSVKKHKFQKFTPVPDSLLERARQENAYVAMEASNVGPTTDLAAIGAGRTSVLEHNLDLLGEGSVSRTRVDHDGYLSAMIGSSISSETEIGDIKKARLLLKSVTSTNPRHAPGWIAAARLEEKAGKPSDARKIILDGCRKCPRDDEIWIEAARLHPSDLSRRILAQAVRYVPKSLKVWMCAADLERDIDAKRRVLRKALEIVPTSEMLWKAAVELEQPVGARILLSRAVECAPTAPALWLALAKLEPYAEAKNVLRRARKALPGEISLWITESQLEEAYHGANSPEVERIVAEAVRTLSFEPNGVSRTAWLNEAEMLDTAGCVGTLRAIVTSTSSIGIETEDRMKTLLDDAKRFEEKGCLHLARAFYHHLTRTFANDIAVWTSFTEFERRQDEFKQMQKVLEDAILFCQGADVLWLMLAKDKWKRNGAEAARDVLRRAFEVLPDRESIWLAAAKVETESGEFDRARHILETARSKAPSSKVYMKSALLERQLGHCNAEKQLLCRGLEAFPNGEKLWLMLAQWFERGEQENGHIGNGHIKDEMDEDRKSEVKQLFNARGVYMKAVDRCKTCVALWIGYCRCEERGGVISKARAILERGREHCHRTKDVDLLWRESVYLEVRQGNQAVAQSILARGLQKCKESGHLWALSVALEGRKGQKAKSVDAIKACPHDALVILEVAKFIWRSGKLDKAKAWLMRSLELDSDFGDSWATLVAFEMEHGNEAAVQQTLDRVEKAEPKYGDLWVSVSKKVGNERLRTAEVVRQAAHKVKKDTNITGLFY